ncbi:TIGR03435 family protein [Granulicella pectinivorans]|jgi:uncharacterized protein (TIGR03435 family)|nr:TIGR03435 family protein [Granulicella pectinivorans]
MLCLAPVCLMAQTVAAAPAPVPFEVVSIRPHQLTGNDPSDRKILPGGRFVARATSVRTLIRIATGLDDNRISGAPGWIDGELFDIDATTADRAEVKTASQFQGLILSLLEERFQFKFHRAEKEGQVYWLEVDKPGKLGPSLKLSAEDAKPNMSVNANSARTQMKVSSMSMTDIAAGMNRQVGKPVQDHTDLKGLYDFQIEWSAEDAPNASSPSLFTVVKEQLGLKLQPAKGVIGTMVIDRVERPSDN